MECLSEKMLLSIYITLFQEKLGYLMSFRKKKTIEVVFKLCVALLHSDHLRPDAFLSLRGTVRVTTEVVNFIDKNQAV